jgi:hypothetical protein
MSIIRSTPVLAELNPAAAGSTVAYNSTYVFKPILALCRNTYLQSVHVTNGRGHSVIAVPDIGKPHSARAWTDGTSNWLTTVLPGLLTRPRILEFQYVADQGDTFSWELLLHCGDALIQELLSRADDPQVLGGS